MTSTLVLFYHFFHRCVDDDEKGMRSDGKANPLN